LILSDFNSICMHFSPSFLVTFWGNICKSHRRHAIIKRFWKWPKQDYDSVGHSHENYFARLHYETFPSKYACTTLHTALHLYCVSLTLSSLSHLSHYSSCARIQMDSLHYQYDQPPLAEVHSRKLTSWPWTRR